jgi:hypothetical protein
MSHKELHTPKIADEHIRKLYHLANRFALPMTQHLNLIVACAIEDLSRKEAGD